jgi:2-amino-4-hydroxy-6-hydroxymethyldihydropteridine diphosphokinase
MASVLLAFGGNLGNVRASIERAIGMLIEGGDIELRARSSDYVTPPWGVTEQPDFVNACIEVGTALSPRALLDRTRAVESALGRRRDTELRWGPRPIDIDILAYDDLQMNEPELTLPHPALFERAFVLVPLAEIVPDRTIARRKVRDALAGVDARGIRQVPPQLSRLV